MSDKSEQQSKRSSHTAQDTLEVDFVDTFGIPNILDMLAEICDGKAEHLQSYWLDTTASKNWYDMSDVLSNAAKRARTLLG